MSSFINSFIRAGILSLAAVVFISGCTAIRESVVRSEPLSKEKTLVAVFPVENLSGTKAPLKQIREALIQSLRAEGVHLLDEKILDEFMARHRIRYVGGVDRSTARALREETGTDAVLVTSLELYEDQFPPKISFTSRLVSSSDPPVILWIDSVGLAGDDTPGVLGLGLIEEPKELLGKALGSLVASLKETLSGERERKAEKRKFRPKMTFRSQVMDPGRRYVVAVLPFFNRSDRKNAGEIMVLHFVRELQEIENVDVVEPGVVWQELLRFRIIMEDGLSLPDADAIFSSVGANLVLTGKVLDYQDTQGSWGTPVVDFSAVMIEAKSREVVWASKSYNKGSDGVFFFDWGRVSTAHEMASQMAQSVGEMMMK